MSDLSNPTPGHGDVSVDRVMASPALQDIVAEAGLNADDLSSGQLRVWRSFNEDGKPPAKHNYDDRVDYYFRFGGYSHHAGEFQNYLEYFGRCLDENTDPRPNLGDGIQVMAVLMAIERALQSGQPVAVRTILGEFGLAQLDRQAATKFSVTPA